MECRERVSLDDVFDAFAHVERRRLLLALRRENPVAMPSSDGTDAGNGFRAGDGSGASERRIGMRHLHLPKLADYGLIEWDRDGNVVTKGPHFEEVGPLLELLADYGEELPEGWP